jgi:hypothetical protein
MSGVGLGAGAWIGLNPLASGQIIAGQAAMANSASTFTVSGLSIGTTNYMLQLTVSNLVDLSVKHLTPTITAKTATGFTFQTQQTTDHDNYEVEYLIVKL